MNKLTRNGVAKLSWGQQSTQQRIIVEINNLKLKSEEIQCFEISDGVQTIKGFVKIKEHPHLEISKIGKMTASGKFIVTIEQHYCHQYGGTKVIEILKIGKDTETNYDYLTKHEFNDCRQSQKPARYEQKVQTINNGHNFETGHSNQNTGGGIFDADQSIIDKKIETITQERLKQFQKISDLYVDFQHWEIIVRVLDSSFKEFYSKQGKMIKLLTLGLIDRAGIKIQASLFGEQARQEFERIKKGAVYRVSGGQIKEHFYSQTMAEGCSKFNIILNKQSKIVEVSDIPSIPYGREHVLTLPQVLEDLNYQRFYDIEVMILHIGEQRQTQKEGGKKVFKKILLVGDPQTRKSIECILWSKYMAIDQRLLFRSVLLKSFRLNNYRDKLSLCSVFRSEIQLSDSTRFSRYQTFVKDIEFQEVNSKKGALKPTLLQQKSSQIRTIKELENELMFLGPLETTTSEIEIWITFIKMQGRWCYGACNNPRCKRATDSFNKCVHCGSYNEQVVKKYSIPIQLTDFTGSLWTTAFEDFATDIFKAYKLSDIEKMNEARLKELAEKHLYLNYKVRIVTKKESEGVFRHAVVGKPSEIEVGRALQANIIKIKKAIE